MKKLLFLVSVAIMTAGCAFAAENPQIESYAHPTMFGSQTQQTIEGQAKALYVVGEKVAKDKDQATVNGKKNVTVDTWVSDVLALIKANSKGVFNPKMPILRSEMAVVLAEGLSIPSAKAKYEYKDIPSTYWAKSWIDKALVEGVMIGYPDRNFRPDQPITKAEVFATIAQLINVPTNSSDKLCCVKGYKMEQIPDWATAPTREVIASKLLENIPDIEKAAKCKYLSKEQVAYIVGSLRQNYMFNSKFTSGKYTPTFINVKMVERVDSRHANIGDKFIAKTTKAVTVEGQAFAAGSEVVGEVVEIVRPGVKNPGYVKIKFNEIKNGKCSVKFSRNITEACAKNSKNTNVVARVFALPFSAAGRVAGVAGRTGAAALNVAGNGTERLGDNLSNTFANLMSLQPKSSIRSFGKGFVTVGYGIYDIAKLAVSGTFGAVYEVGDELMYLILPSKSNDSSLNVGEELVIVF